MSNDKFFTVILRDDLNEEDLNTIISLARSDYKSAGHEEFSLSEAEVDNILGEEAFCGADLSEELLEKLENEANKTYKFYFTGEDSKILAQSFCTFLKESEAENVEVVESDIQDWNENWKKHYKPIDLGSLIILPVWDSEEEVGEGKERIIINPGMGFGTGTHETTRQCLLSLQDELESGEKFHTCLDLGAGSGILGIAYQKICRCDAQRVDYVDIDQRALDNNKDNLNLNSLASEDKSFFYLRSDFKIMEPYDLVFANILEHVLIEEIELISSSVKPEKILIVSGILKEQKENTVNNFGKYFRLKKERSEGDWMALTFIKK